MTPAIPIFANARGPMGFTQRQAAGKFTRDEATGFIDQLQAAQAPPESDSFVTGPERRSAAEEQRRSAEEQLLRHMPARQLADELKRRGWTVVEP